ncbi:protein N-terminal asparagine amidohydrolase [Puma concolor]|uniref:Protein N-terminal asparagine amidohydrolase n=1 Tax=Puma concolor TaxID=9696 RepID=A0A6P6H9P2_PUMCO|nr:protein N-terminal asparagine amidohydrolase [Puma concolor]
MLAATGEGSVDTGDPGVGTRAGLATATHDKPAQSGFRARAGLWRKRGGTERARPRLDLLSGFLTSTLKLFIVGEFDRQEDDIHLVTLCVTELNDREENEKHFPIIYGIAVNIKTAEIYRASFPDRGPEEELRAARALTGGPMISIYDAKTEQLRIGPYSWMPFPHVDFWLQQDDKQILENLSTSPLAEPPHFVEHIRSTLMFLKKHPSPTNALFPGNKALLYKKNEDGLWEKIPSPGS